MCGAIPSLATAMAYFWYTGLEFVLTAIALCSLFALRGANCQHTLELLGQDEALEPDSAGGPSPECKGVVSPFLASPPRTLFLLFLNRKGDAPTGEWSIAVCVICGLFTDR